MQSSLKKSLYLGLAALSFASVASATNASSANAAKKHSHKRVAKKVTYKTTDRNLDQSVVFQATGKSAVYSKPGTVKGARVVATKADMGSKANSKSVKDQFMAYQSAVTSKGVHYYKVVSFDKKVRGYVYVGGVNKVDGKTSTATPSNTTGYLKSNRLFNVAYGSQFGAKLKSFNGINFSTDKFTVNDAVQVRNGAKYYNVTDQNNAMVNGWVNADFFSNEPTQAVTEAQNNAKAIKVNFYDVSRPGVIVKTANVQPHTGFYLANDNTNAYNKDEMTDAIDNALVNSGYSYTGSGFTNLNGTPDKVLQGSSLNVPVKTSATKVAHFAAKGVSYDNGVSTVNLNSKNFAGISNAQAREFVAYSNDTVKMDKLVSDFFDQGQVWNVVKQDGQTYRFDKAATMKAFNEAANNYKNKQGNNDDNQFTMQAAFNGKSLPVYYVKDDSAQVNINNADNNANTNIVLSGSTDSNVQNNKVSNQTLVNDTLKDYDSYKSIGLTKDQFANNILAKKNNIDAIKSAFSDQSVAISGNNTGAYNDVKSIIDEALNVHNANIVNTALNTKSSTGHSTAWYIVNKPDNNASKNDKDAYAKNINAAFSSNMRGKGFEPSQIVKLLKTNQGSFNTKDANGKTVYLKDTLLNDVNVLKDVK